MALLSCELAMQAQACGHLLVERIWLGGLLSWVEGIGDSTCMDDWVRDNLASSAITNVPNSFFGIVESLIRGQSGIFCCVGEPAWDRNCTVMMSAVGRPGLACTSILASLS
jgi:hypothetical protein